MAFIYTAISSKGGVGKTTTLLGLAMTLAKSGNRVMLIDADPNEPMSRFKETAMKNGYWADNVDTISIFSGPENGRPIDELIASVEDANFQYILVDTKGGEGDFVGYIAQLSDAIIVPTGLTSVDIDGAESTLLWFESLRLSEIQLPPIRVLITGMPARSKMNKSHEHNLEEIQNIFPLMDTTIPYHAHIQNMSLYGLFDKVAQQCRASDDPKVRIQAKQFENALGVFDKLKNEIDSVIATEAVA